MWFVVVDPHGCANSCMFLLIVDLRTRCAPARGSLYSKHIDLLCSEWLSLTLAWRFAFWERYLRTDFLEKLFRHDDDELHFRYFNDNNTVTSRPPAYGASNCCTAVKQTGKTDRHKSSLLCCKWFTVSRPNCFIWWIHGHALTIVECEGACQPLSGDSAKGKWANRYARPAQCIPETVL